ncbi:MAG: SecY-interacting protein [Oceanospirillaceae bacterium]
MNQNNTTPLCPITNTALDQFVSRWYEYHRNTNSDLLKTQYDSQWPSLCYIDSKELTDGAPCLWKPIQQSTQDMFARLSEALETDIHPSINTFYSRYWSNHLSARCSEGELELLQAWNQEDMERLRSNLLGHALDKKKRKQTLSFFFAITSPDDGMLCINNNNGEVWYEMPGKKPIRKIADSLAQFVDGLIVTPI